MIGYDEDADRIALDTKQVLATMSLVTVGAAVRFSRSRTVSLAVFVGFEIGRARREIRHRGDERDQDDVRPEHHPEADVRNAAVGAHRVDADLGPRSSDSDEGGACDGGETPLPADFLQRRIEFVGAPVGDEHADQQSRSPEEKRLLNHRPGSLESVLRV